MSAKDIEEEEDLKRGIFHVSSLRNLRKEVKGGQNKIARPKTAERMEKPWVVN